jgi:hypothetical protein
VMFWGSAKAGKRAISDLLKGISAPLSLVNYPNGDS